MAEHRCYIIPPHLFKAMADSRHLEEPHREQARAALGHIEEFSTSRKSHFDNLGQPRGLRKQRREERPSIIPPSILSTLADSPHVDEAARAGAKRDLEHRTTLDQQRLAGFSPSAANADDEATATETAKRTIYTVNNSRKMTDLPGKVVRKEGQDAVDDKPANEAYDNIGDVLKAYDELFNWKSIDNENKDIMGTVHFGKSYQNAYWDSQRAQMVFGDGGEFIRNFTLAIDVIGHEMTHAVTEYTSPLVYFGQSGALNEHISDVFGSIIKQWKQKEDSASADWLVGEDCILPGVKGVALRSMKAPGTAYDDPRFGKDPQPDNFKDYRTTFEDNGGVHIYSGIPNKAYYLASVAFGGFSWEKAGQIWWKTMTSGVIAPRCNFLQFAEATVTIAEEEFDADAAKIVRKAWSDVGLSVKKVSTSRWNGCLSALH